MSAPTGPIDPTEPIGPAPVVTPVPPAGPRGGTLRPALVALGLLTCLLCGLYLALRRTAEWAARHPAPGALAGLLALALGWALVRAMPRPRALWRAARAGMARADAEAAAAPPAPAGCPPPAPTTTAPADEGGPARLLSADHLLALDADGFEETVAELCTRDGCRDVQVVGGAGDLGADVLATAPDGRRLVLQCKRYAPPHKVGSQDLQRFGGTCWTIHGADAAFLVTTSEFTEPALDYAAESGIRCVDRSELTVWIRGGLPAPWERPAAPPDGPLP
ncbi:restriction endonuclease [Streptomyces sp. NPDC059740]|uniref:restriction endonuclease n=1 Tax=Streptomyces sp. NPDC059740 TaxID=3346926 RepID=UPI00364D9FCB